MDKLIYPNDNFKHVYRDIINNNFDLESVILGKHACRSIQGIRRQSEDIPDKKNIRPAFFHDTDRIIHCKGYSRYIDKTQVFSHIKNDHITRRVLHVQIVSKIARTIGRFLSANEDLIEAIALAHDLGHAPFGHVGEEILAEIMEEKESSSFVHNAQSVRLLDTIENSGKGLNLTLQVLDGIIGHNGELWEQSIKYDSLKLSWKYLDNNLKQCFTEPRKNRPEKSVFPSTLEGCIVRVSDVFAYIGRDIEDAILLGVVKRADLPKDATEILGNTNQSIIHNLAMDITHNSFGKSELCFSEACFEAMKALLNFNYEKIYKTDFAEKQKVKFGKMIKELFDSYVEDIEKGDESSPLYAHYLKGMKDSYQSSSSNCRIIADFISGMTDHFLVDQYLERFIPKEVVNRINKNRD